MMISLESVTREKVFKESFRPVAAIDPDITALLGEALAKIEAAARAAEGSEIPEGFSGSLGTASELLRYARSQVAEFAESPLDFSDTEVNEGQEGSDSGYSIDDDLAKLLPQVLSNAGVEWDVFGQPETGLLPRAAQSALMTILREVLVNTARHAHANRVTIHYFHGKNCFRVRIADDGRGFCLHHPRKSLGLARIREQAERLGGEIRIESSPRAGTRVVFTMPLGEQLAALPQREDIPA